MTELIRPRVEYVNPKEIENNQFQPRLYISEEKMEELKESITQTGGNNTPVTLMARDDKLITLEGHRRVRACHELEFLVEAKIIDDLPDADAWIIAIVTNIQSEEMSVVDKILSVRTLRDLGLSQDAVKEKLGMSKGVVQKYDTLNRSWVTEQIVGIISWLPLNKAILMGSIPESQKEFFAEQCISKNWSEETTKKYVEMWNNINVATKNKLIDGEETWEYIYTEYQNALKEQQDSEMVQKHAKVFGPPLKAFMHKWNFLPPTPQVDASCNVMRVNIINSLKSWVETVGIPAATYKQFRDDGILEPLLEIIDSKLESLKKKAEKIVEEKTGHIPLTCRGCLKEFKDKSDLKLHDCSYKEPSHLISLTCGKCGEDFQKKCTGRHEIGNIVQTCEYSAIHGCESEKFYSVEEEFWFEQVSDTLVKFGVDTASEVEGIAAGFVERKRSKADLDPVDYARHKAAEWKEEQDIRQDTPDEKYANIIEEHKMLEVQIREMFNFKFDFEVAKKQAIEEDRSFIGILQDQLDEYIFNRFHEDLERDGNYSSLAYWEVMAPRVTRFLLSSKLQGHPISYVCEDCDEKLIYRCITEKIHLGKRCEPRDKHECTSDKKTIEKSSEIDEDTTEVDQSIGEEETLSNGAENSISDEVTVETDDGTKHEIHYGLIDNDWNTLKLKLNKNSTEYEALRRVTEEVVRSEINRDTFIKEAMKQLEYSPKNKLYSKPKNKSPKAVLHSTIIDLYGEFDVDAVEKRYKDEYDQYSIDGIIYGHLATQYFELVVLVLPDYKTQTVTIIPRIVLGQGRREYQARPHFTEILELED